MSIAKKDVRVLLDSLAAQGCTLKEQGNSSVLVFFPNGGSTVVHQSVSDANALTIKRNEVRRAGLVWPFDDSKAAKAARKGEHVTIEATKQQTAADGRAVAGLARGEVPEPEQQAPELKRLVDVRRPPGADVDTKQPSPETVARVRAALLQVSEPFWTADVLAHLQEGPGFRNSSGMQRLQGVLYWLGYRVVASKPNRSGHVYRWALSPADDRARLQELPAPAKAKPAVGRQAPALSLEQRRAKAAEPASPDRAAVEAVAKKVETEHQQRVQRREAMVAQVQVHRAGNGREFIDTVDSWTADSLPPGTTIEGLTAMLAALGLRWELRVWRAEA